MANVASALKRMRADGKKRQRNRYQHKTTKTFIKKVLKATEKNEQLIETFNKTNAMLDKLVKRGIIHANKRNRKKAQIANHLNQLK